MVVLPPRALVAHDLRALRQTRQNLHLAQRLRSLALGLELFIRALERVPTPVQAPDDFVHFGKSAARDAP